MRLCEVGRLEVATSQHQFITEGKTGVDVCGPMRRSKSKSKPRSKVNDSYSIAIHQLYINYCFSILLVYHSHHESAVDPCQPL